MKQIQRREFMAGTAAAVAAGTCLCGLAGCASITGIGNTPEIPPGAYIIENGKIKIALDQAPSLAKVGGSVKITDPGLPEPLIIAHVTENEYVALSLKCTHRGVEIEYRPQEKILRCASLGHTRYALDGSKIKGPAKGPLKSYEARLGLLDKNKLLIKLP